jgi:2-polyprenyl-3-methyl-5-hydroxy-6-metoxy-1,4-benzoquinol methylase
MSESDWFEDWFDTKYYHILYKNRDDVEAKQFIFGLMEQLELKSGMKLLDLACGKGRHSKTLNDLGYNVLGVDLSKKSIADAEKSTNSGLSFQVHDMREVIPNHSFDAIFNLFTSFGYFDSPQDNERMCLSISKMLEPGGRLVIDFMNARKVIESLVLREQKTIQGVSFDISRRYDGLHIYKEIRIEDKSHHLNYTERVQALELADFHVLLEPYFEIDHVFGSLDLKPFEVEESDRLIIIAKRKK